MSIFAPVCEVAEINNCRRDSGSYSAPKQIRPKFIANDLSRGVGDINSIKLVASSAGLLTKSFSIRAVAFLRTKFV